MTGYDHVVKLCLAPELRSALNHYGAKHDLDKQFAALHLLVKALKCEGLLDVDAADYFLSKYSKTISSMSDRVLLSAKPKTPLEMEAKQKLDERNRLFAMVIEQWDLPHKAGWKDNWLKQAEKAPECCEAVRLLEKVAARVGLP